MLEEILLIACLLVLPITGIIIIIGIIVIDIRHKRIERGNNMDNMENLEKHYRAGLEDGMQMGIAFGRFYEKHNITKNPPEGKIPPELIDEFIALSQEELKKVKGAI